MQLWEWNWIRARVGEWLSWWHLMLYRRCIYVGKVSFHTTPREHGVEESGFSERAWYACDKDEVFGYAIFIDRSNGRSLIYLALMDRRRDGVSETTSHTGRKRKEVSYCGRQYELNFRKHIIYAPENIRCQQGRQEWQRKYFFPRHMRHTIRHVNIIMWSGVTFRSPRI